MERTKRNLIANKTGRLAAAKSDGARRQSDRKTGLIKWSACGRESKGAPILGTSARCRAKKVAQRPDVKFVHLYRIDETEIFT